MFMSDVDLDQARADFEEDVYAQVVGNGYRCADGREFCVWDIADDEEAYTEEQADRVTDACLEYIAKLQREGY